MVHVFTLSRGLLYVAQAGAGPTVLVPADAPAPSTAPAPGLRQQISFLAQLPAAFFGVLTRGRRSVIFQRGEERAEGNVVLVASSCALT